MRAGGAPRGPRGNGPARANGPAQNYNTGQGFGPPQNYNTGQQFRPGPAYPPAQDYNTGQGFAAPEDYNTGQQFQPGPGYPPTQGFDRGQGRPRAPRSQPDPAHPQAAGGNRRLYAVPDTAHGPEGMGPGGGQMVQYGGGQAVALADPDDWARDPQPAWDTQGALATMPAPASAPPRPRTRPGAPSPRPRTPQARPVGQAGPARPRTTRAQDTAGRQRKAMRIAAGATVATFSIAVVAAAANIAHFGPKFFVFREAGAGETGGAETDQNFLAQQAAAAKAAAQGHTPGKHSAKNTSGAKSASG